MNEVRINKPEPVPITYDLIGLTEAEADTILGAVATVMDAPEDSAYSVYSKLHKAQAEAHGVSRYDHADKIRHSKRVNHPNQ